MFMKKTQSRRARGFTLTEAAIVLGIVGLILGAIWVAAASVYANMRVNTANRQLMTIVQNIRSLYATQTVTTGLDTTSAISAGIIPADMVISATSATNSWGGGVVVNSVNSGGGAGTGFNVRFLAVPRAGCIDFIVAASGQGHDEGLVGVSMSGGATTGTSFPVSPAAATTLCASATNNTPTFTFRLR